jgi:hypothetical protein
MTPENFVDGVLKTVISESVDSYQELFADPGEVTDPYWKRALALYETLSSAQRKVLFEIVRQVKVDALSEIFGILDGSSQLNNKFHDFELFYTGGKSRVKLNGDLQDLLLERTEAE